jgi:phosphatidylserine decarboxylase
VRLAPEGRAIVLGTALLLLACAALALWRGGWWTVLAGGWLPVALWTPWFFRDPVREGPRGDHLVIAPADGRVVSVTEVDEPEFFRGRSQRISVFMSIFDVHVNRYPAGGAIRYRDYRSGTFVNATRDKASEANERMSIGIDTSRGPLLVRQIAGLIARRIVTDGSLGAIVDQGARLGIIRFGSRVDTFIPQDARVSVRVGDRTTAGVTVLAQWPQ